MGRRLSNSVLRGVSSGRCSDNERMTTLKFSGQRLQTASLLIRGCFRAHGEDPVPREIAWQATRGGASEKQRKR